MPPKTMNPTKYAKRLKEVRRVKNAIKFREEKKKERYEKTRVLSEATGYKKNMQAYNGMVSNSYLREARAAAREDWELGPLRPNRAYGAAKVQYGVVKREHMSPPELPEGWFGGETKLKRIEKKGAPEHVLQNRFPIVKDDRVVVIKGPEKGKIGIVKSVIEDKNMVTVAGVNEGYINSNWVDSSYPVPKLDWEIPFSYDMVRLVIPHDVYRKVGGRTVKAREDVIVESIDVEKHTRGIDPFTGRYSYRIPEEHQVDPKTGIAIWHRYVAGTRHAIPWPWEKEEQKDAAAEGPKDVAKQEKPSSSILEKINPLTWLSKEKKTAVAAPAAKEDVNAGPYNPENQITSEPPEDDPVEYEDDTPRNLVEADSISSRAEFEVFIPTLVYPPMPEDVVKELSDKRAASEARKNVKRVAPRVEKVPEERPVFNMKTPLQLRWELQQANKPKTPAEPSQDLLAALGQHMAKQGLKLETLQKEVEKAKQHA